MKYVILYLILILTIFLGCEKHKTVNEEQLRWAFVANSSSTFHGYIYEGEKNKFQYFKSNWNFSPEYFKIEDDKIKIEPENLFKYGERKLPITISNSDANYRRYKYFGETKFEKLYIGN